MTELLANSGLTLACLELWYMQNLRNNQYPVKHLYDVVFS